MDREPAAVHIVRFFTEQIKQLGVAHGNQEIKAVIGIAHNKEQGGFFVPQGVQFQLIVGRDLPQFGNIEYRQPRTAGNQYRFCGFACCYLSRTYSSFFITFS